MASRRNRKCYEIVESAVDRVTVTLFTARLELGYTERPYPQTLELEADSSGLVYDVTDAGKALVLDERKPARRELSWDGVMPLAQLVRDQLRIRMVGIRQAERA